MGCACSLNLLLHEHEFIIIGNEFPGSCDGYPTFFYNASDILCYVNVKVAIHMAKLSTLNFGKKWKVHHSLNH